LISIADLKEINKFYQTPVGKRISVAQPKISILSILLAWKILNFMCETCAKNKKHLQN